MEHKSEHSVAAAAAASEMNDFAIVPYEPQQHDFWQQYTIETGPSCELPEKYRDETVDVFELVRQGDLERLKQRIEVCVTCISFASGLVNLY